MPLHYQPMPSDLAASYRRREPDAYGQTPELRVSDGIGCPAVIASPISQRAIGI